MTCAHVLGLIDAGPSAGYPRAHYDAARRHAETCATCGRAMAIAGQLARDLAEWPDVAPPADLAAVVMARIARGDEGRLAEAGAAPALGRRASWAWAAWAMALGGLAAGAALAWSAATGGAALVRLAGPGLGGAATSAAAWPALPEALLLAAGLGLYAAGLFQSSARPATASGSAVSR
jgi:hypothetical protein